MYIDLCFLTGKEKCGFAWSPEFIKATWKGSEWGSNPPSGLVSQVKRNRYLSYLQMPVRTQRPSKCLRSPEPLGNFYFTEGKGVGRVKAVFWRNYPLLVFLPSGTLLSDAILSSLSICGHISGRTGSDEYLCIFTRTRSPLGNWESGLYAGNISA